MQLFNLFLFLSIFSISLISAFTLKTTGPTKQRPKKKSAIIFSSLPLLNPRISSSQLSLFGGGGKKEGGGTGDVGAKGPGGMGAMMEQFKQAQEIGKKTQAMQKELEALTLVGADVEDESNAKVKVFVNGQNKPIKVEIVSEEWLASAGSEGVSEAIGLAMAAAHLKGSQASAKKMMELYSEMGLPQMGSGGAGAGAGPGM